MGVLRYSRDPRARPRRTKDGGGTPLAATTSMVEGTLTVCIQKRLDPSDPSVPSSDPLSTPRPPPHICDPLRLSLPRIPGPSGKVVNVVELHVKDPTDNCFHLVMRQTAPQDTITAGLWPSRAKVDFRPDDLAHSRQGYRVPLGADAGALAAAARDVTANYAILDQLEGFRDNEGKLELKLAWPDTNNKPQHWKQRTVGIF